jgi:hypothetical protein
MPNAADMEGVIGEKCYVWHPHCTNERLPVIASMAPGACSKGMVLTVNSPSSGNESYSAIRAAAMDIGATSVTTDTVVSPTPAPLFSNATTADVGTDSASAGTDLPPASAMPQVAASSPAGSMPSSGSTPLNGSMPSSGSTPLNGSIPSAVPVSSAGAFVIQGQSMTGNGDLCGCECLCGDNEEALPPELSRGSYGGQPG